MPFEFVVLGQDGAQEIAVPLNAELHHDFMAAASSAGLVFLQRFDDYYEDVQISVTNLPMMIEQVSVLQASGCSSALRLFLSDLDSLISYAIASKKTLHAIAD